MGKVMRATLKAANMLNPTAMAVNRGVLKGAKWIHRKTHHAIRSGALVHSNMQHAVVKR